MFNLLFKYKIFPIIYLSVVLFFSLLIPAQAEIATLKWTIDECNKKCDEIKKETLAQINKQIELLGKNPTENDKAIGNAQAARTQIETWDCTVNEADGLCECAAPPAAVTLQIPIGDTTIAVGLVAYIISFYTWGTRATAFLAVIMIMIAGLEWLTAAGDQGKISKAKDRIQNSVIGLVLVLATVFLLNLINSRLTNLSGFQIKMVPTIIQQIYFCDNLPDGVVLTDKENKTVKKEDALCNEDYYYNPNNLSQGVSNPNIAVYGPPADTSKAVKPAICKGRYCANLLMTCGALLRQDILSCQNPKEICESYSKDKCQEADASYFQNTDYGCAKGDNMASSDKCVYGRILKCPTRVDCSKSPECWDQKEKKGKDCADATLSAEKARRICVDSDDDDRPVEGADGICCQKDDSYQCVLKNEDTYGVPAPVGESVYYAAGGVKQPASPRLASVIECIKTSVPSAVVTSVTDSQVGSDTAKIIACALPTEKDQCQAQYHTTCKTTNKGSCPNYCKHGCSSCHYGCAYPYSFAVDFGGDLCEIVKAANQPGCKNLGIKSILGPIISPLPESCGKYTPYSGHDDHIHISTTECSCSVY